MCSSDLAPPTARVTSWITGAFDAARYGHDSPTDSEKDDGKMASQWMVLARTDADLGTMARGPTWLPVREASRGPVWRDDFANLFWAWKRKDSE